jgi:GntR family transcriptional regulator
VGEEPVPDFAAERLGVKPGTVVVTRSRTYKVDGRPVQMSVAFIPVELARGTAIAYSDTGPGGTYARLDERGFGPARFTEEVIVRAATPDEAHELQLPSGGPRVFEIIRTAFAADDRPVEVNRMVLDADAYRLVHHFSA